ncbi:hypothetical protein [Lactiplantibacillus pentosus]|uniref:hypothetical protein n=1 Tax=Lactiplantibacillus pentosus TaxID=1589 RepID=UPI003C262669
MHSKMDCISRSPLFAPLSPTIKTKLITVTHHRKFFQKGQLIRQPLDHQEGMLILDEGTAKVYALADNGKEKIIDLHILGMWSVSAGYSHRMKIRVTFKRLVMRGFVRFSTPIFSSYSENQPVYR